MSGRHSYDKLREKMSPERRRRNEARANAELEQMLLRELRKLVGMTQSDLAKALGVSQASVSQTEAADDMQISTLQRIVHALGGELEIVVKLPRGTVAVTPQFTPAA